MIALSTERSVKAVSSTACARSSSSAVTASRSWATSIGGSVRRPAGAQVARRPLGGCRSRAPRCTVGCLGPGACDDVPRDPGSGAAHVGVSVVGGGAVAVGGQNPAGRLDGTHALGAQCHHLSHPSLVLVTVEAVAPRGPDRPQEAVAALPRAQHVGAHADLGGELAYPHRRRYRSPHDHHANPAAHI